MNEQNIAERLKYFIENRNLTNSQFADMCGIPRPSLSQLLTGRNKKMSDVMVRQIHNMFPELSIVWLLFGEGPMENPQIEKSYEKENSEDGQSGLGGLFGEFDENPPNEDSNKIIFTNEGSAAKNNSKENGLKELSEVPKAVELKMDKLQNRIKELQDQMENLIKNPRKVNHITIYYDDSTFETFFPR